MEPRKMGEYISYFESNPVVGMGGSYKIELQSFD